MQVYHLPSTTPVVCGHVVLCTPLVLSQDLLIPCIVALDPFLYSPATASGSPCTPRGTASLQSFLDVLVAELGPILIEYCPRFQAQLARGKKALDEVWFMHSVQAQFGPVQYWSRIGHAVSYAAARTMARQRNSSTTCKLVDTRSPSASVVRSPGGEARRRTVVDRGGRLLTNCSWCLMPHYTRSVESGKRWTTVRYPFSRFFFLGGSG